MAKGTFREESACGNRSRTADLHHDPGGRGRRAERRRLSADYCFERFDNRILQFFPQQPSRRCFWAASREGLRRGSAACSLLSAHAARNSSAYAGIDDLRSTVGLDFANSR